MIQILLVFAIKIIISLRFKERILDIFLTPVSLCFIIAIAINSYVQARFRKGVYWKGRIYDVNTPDKISLVGDDCYEQQASEGQSHNQYSILILILKVLAIESLGQPKLPFIE